MRHRKDGVKLNRSSSHRQAMFRNMVTSLLKHDQIRTTDVKAKELRRWADHVITLAKRGDLHARRQAMAIVREKTVVHKLFEEAQKRFGKINGGYTRIVKLGHRPGDAAPISLVELIAVEAKEKKGKKKAKPATKKKGQTTAKATEKKTAEPKAGKEAARASQEDQTPKETQETAGDKPNTKDGVIEGQQGTPSETLEPENEGQSEILEAKTEESPSVEEPLEADKELHGDKEADK